MKHTIVNPAPRTLPASAAAGVPVHFAMRRARLRDRLAGFIAAEQWRAFTVTENECRLVTYTCLHELILLPAPVGLSTTPEAFRRALTGKGAARARKYTDHKLSATPRRRDAANATAFIGLPLEERQGFVPERDRGEWLSRAQYALEAGRRQPAERFFIPALLEFGRIYPATAVLVRLRRTTYRFESLSHWLAYRGPGGCQLEPCHLAELGFGDLASPALPLEAEGSDTAIAPHIAGVLCEAGERPAGILEYLTEGPETFGWSGGDERTGPLSIARPSGQMLSIPTYRAA